MAISKDNILNWLQDRWFDFKDQGIYFQAKVGIVVAYAGIVALTLLLTPIEQVDCEIRWTKRKSGMSAQTVVEVVNHDLGTLNNFVVVINGQAVLFDGSKKSGTWQTRISYFAEGDAQDRLSIHPDMLKDAQGFPAPSLFDVQKVTLFDDDKDVIFEAAPIYFESQ